MSLTSTSNRVLATGDGVTTLFNYNKLLYSSTHIQVYLDSVLQTTGYTVGGVPGTSTNVTFSAAPASGVQVLLLRVVPLTQLSVYAVGGAFPAATTEKNFDLAVMGLQQFDDTTNRTLRQPVTDTANIATIPVKASRASKYMAFDANGDPVATTGTSETPNALMKAGGNLTGGVNQARGNITQHATTMDFFATTSPDILDGTGSAVTITACVNAPQAGATRKFYPLVATVMTHGATFDCAGNANLTAAAGDCWIIEAKTVSTYRVTAVKEDGMAVVSIANASLLTSGTLAAARLPAGASVQVVHYTTGAVATGTTVLPQDDTIPQNTEGDEYMSLAITPTSASNKLLIQVVLFASHGSAIWLSVALFQDATAGALGVTSSYQTTATAGLTVSLNHYMTSGTTSATTFKVRAGAHVAGTLSFNGQGGTRLFGGVLSSSVTITEIQA